MNSEKNVKNAAGTLSKNVEASQRLGIPLNERPNHGTFILLSIGQ